MYPPTARQPIAPPPPGNYSKVAEQEYHGWSAVNKSLLTEVAKSPMHARYWLDTKDSGRSDAMRLGTLTHLAILEPDRYDALPVVEKIDGRTKAGKDQLKEVGECVWTHEAEVIGHIRRNVRASNAARKVSSTPGELEMSIVWERDGIPCKARLDKLCPGRAIVDLKTCRDASEHAFNRAIADYGYDRQAAWYCDGWRRLTGEELRYIVIAAQTEPPYPVCVYLIDTDMVAEGEAANDAAFGTLKQCLETGVWPGPGDDRVMVATPSKWKRSA